MPATKRTFTDIPSPKDGYFDAAGNLRLEFIDRECMEDLAQEMCRVWPRDSKPTHQVRRFFQHCRAIEAKLRASSSTWQAEEASFRLLDAAAADAFGKEKPKIPELFHDFIKQNIAGVKNQDDFLKGFLPHFEALVGFGMRFFR